MNILKNERGSAMLTALGIMMMLALLGTAVVQTARTDMDIAENYQDDLKSFYSAEAGIEHAFATIRDSINWRGGFDEHDFAGGWYTVTMVDSSSGDPLVDTIIVTSTGFNDGAMTTVQVKFAHLSAFQWAAFADEYMRLCGTAYTDSFDSDSGTYAATVLLEGGNIGSNGHVDICGTADINGDASTSTPGEMDVTGSGFVNGDTTTTAPVVILDPVPQSEIDFAEANSMAPAGMTGAFTYNAGTKTLRVNPGQTLTLASGVYYFTDIRINGIVELAPGASVQIYLVGDADIQAQAEINVAGAPADFQIFSVGDDFTIAGGAEMWTVLYAPDTEISLIGSSELYGAYLGNIANNNGGANFHYDRSLGDLQLGNVFAKVSWREL